MRSLIFTFFMAITQVSRAVAQTEPPVGVRATGMGGAFVAVADDASAVFWNPAGLASGSYFSLALDDNRLQTPDDTSFPHRRSAFMLALGAPALGMSYLSTTVTRAAQPVITLDPASGTNTRLIRVERLAARHVGATLVQSLTRNLAIGATFERRVRGGVSLLVRQTITVAADVDFTKASTSLGEWRDAAIGAEARAARRAWVRGGIHWNTAGGDSGPGAAPIASLGGSYTVYGSVLADGQVSVGSENGDRGWG